MMGHCCKSLRALAFNVYLEFAMASSIKLAPVQCRNCSKARSEMAIIAQLDHMVGYARGVSPVERLSTTVHHASRHSKETRNAYWIC